MEKRKVTSEGYFRLLLILFAAMLFSQFTLVGTMIFLQQMGEIHLDEAGLSTTMLYVLIAAATTGLLASNGIGNVLIIKARSKPTLSEKLRGYQTASILRYALLELPTLIGTYGFLSTGQYWFFIFSGLVIGIFVLIRPRKEKIYEVLQLNHDEIALLNDPKAVVMEYETSND